MENKIQHYGILGMRWGVRRTKAQLRRARGPDAPRRVTKEQYEAAKKAAIRSGDKSTIERWKSHLSNNELNEALTRIGHYQKLSDVGKEKVKSGWEQTKSVMDSISSTVSFVKSSLGAYDIVRTINNTFNSKFQMPELAGTAQSNAVRRQQEAKARQEESKARTLEDEERRKRGT